MKPILLTAIGVVSIVGFDLVASLISVATGFPYAAFIFGSLFIYLLYGFLVGRYSKWYFGALAGAVIGFAECTAGWAISWYIGPGKPEVELNNLIIAITIIFLVIFATLVGLVGGLGSLLFKRSA